MNDYKEIVYNSRMWNLEQIKTFKLISECRSFSKVAEKLNISAAAVGKQIKNLEDNLGATLFYRTTRHVALTELGEIFYEQCETILSEIERTNDLLATHKGKITGKLKIVSAVSFGERHIIPLVKEFLTLYPELTLYLELADRIPDLEKENIDLIMGLMQGLPQHYVCKKIKTDRYALCASLEYMKKFRIPNKPENLTEHDFITHSKRPKPQIVTFKKNMTIYVKPRLWTNSTNAMLQFCLDGLGIAMFHADVVENYIKEKRLIEVLKEYQQPPQSIFLYYKKVEYLQPKLRAFIDFFVGKLTANIRT